MNTNFKASIKPSYLIKKLTQKKFNTNPEFFQRSLDEITISQNLCKSTDYKDKIFGPTNWTEFFKKYPLNSIVYIEENGKIVSFMYATPHREFGSKIDNIEHWGINYIQTHKDFEKKGYAYILTLEGLKDIREKGAKKITLLPNEKSKPILFKVLKNNIIGNIISKDDVYGTLEIMFNNEFLSNNGEVPIINELKSLT